MKTQTRKAAADDYDNLCELFDEIDALHLVNLPDIFQAPNGAAREKDSYLALVADENIGLFVVEIDEKLIGFVHVLLRDTPALPVMIPQ